MPTVQPATPKLHLDLPVRSTPLTLAGSLNVSVQLAGDHGTSAQAFAELRAFLLQHQRLPSPMTPAQLGAARRSLLSTLVLAEDQLLEDPYGLLSVDALEAALADLTPGQRGVQA
jgi:hypothetical protein